MRTLIKSIDRMIEDLPAEKPDTPAPVRKRASKRAR
jgi:hypothetical protein